nr:MAG TPA: hypothetical protein [Bacteriophage sp.]
MQFIMINSSVQTKLFTSKSKERIDRLKGVYQN